MRDDTAIIPAIAAIAMLLLAIAGTWPYGFYQLLRFVVCGTAAYMAFVASGRRLRDWAWLFVGVAILFNPLKPIHFSREVWRVLDLLTAVILGGRLWTMKANPL